MSVDLMAAEQSMYTAIVLCNQLGTYTCQGLALVYTHTDVLLVPVQPRA